LPIRSVDRGGGWLLLAAHEPPDRGAVEGRGVLAGLSAVGCAGTAGRHHPHRDRAGHHLHDGRQASLLTRGHRDPLPNPPRKGEGERGLPARRTEKQALLLVIVLAIILIFVVKPVS